MQKKSTPSLNLGACSVNLLKNALTRVMENVTALEEDHFLGAWEEFDRIVNILTIHKKKYNNACRKNLARSQKKSVN